MDKLEISKRQAKSEDFDFIYSTKKEALYDYVNEIWGWNENYQIETFTKNFNPVNIQVIENRGKSIGVIEIEETTAVIDLINIELIPQYRNKGIGTTIINELLTISNGKNKSVKLRVFKNNSLAYKLYQALGFYRYDESEYHYKLIYDPK